MKGSSHNNKNNNNNENDDNDKHNDDDDDTVFILDFKMKQTYMYAFILYVVTHVLRAFIFI